MAVQIVADLYLLKEHHIKRIHDKEKPYQSMRPGPYAGFWKGGCGILKKWTFLTAGFYQHCKLNQSKYYSEKVDYCIWKVYPFPKKKSVFSQNLVFPPKKLQEKLKITFECMDLKHTFDVALFSTFLILCWFFKFHAKYGKKFNFVRKNHFLDPIWHEIIK